MKRDIQRIMLAAVVPLFLIFILFLLKFMEVGMDWDFSHMGVYPMEKRGIVGIFTHPLIHSGFSHLLANTLPLFFLSWCLFYFYRGIAGRIIWHMFPYFSPANMSWEGHLSGGIMGTLCAFGFLNHGPQRPEPFADETDDDEEEESPEEDINDHNTTDSTDITSQIPVTAYAMPQSAR